MVARIRGHIRCPEVAHVSETNAIRSLTAAADALAVAYAETNNGDVADNITSMIEAVRTAISACAAFIPDPVDAT